MSRTAIVAACLIVLALVAGCSDDPEPALPAVPETASAIAIEARTFTNGAFVRPRFTCDGVNLSPEIGWSGAPNGVQSLAIILNDPDAPGGSYIHWLVYGIPPTVTRVGEAEGKAVETIASGGSQALNTPGDLGFAGPCPPRGESHRYELHVYALDRELELPPLTPRAEVIRAMDGSVVGHGVLTARYQRIEREDENVVFKVTPTP